MVVRAARHRAAGLRSEGARGEGRYRCRRGRAAHRRLRDAVRGAIQQHHPDGVADSGLARARRRHDRRLPVRQRPAGQPPGRGPDRGGCHRHRDRLRHRGDEPRRAGRQRRSRPQLACGVLGHRPARPVHRRRANRQAPRHHPRGHRPVRVRLSAHAKQAWDEGRFDREICRSRRRCSTSRSNPPASGTSSAATRVCGTPRWRA